MDDVPPDPYLAPCCANILMSAPCQRIDFSYAGQHIDGSAFSFVALALGSQPPSGVTVVQAELHNGDTADYSSSSNTLTIDAGLDIASPFGEIVIVHEATHAVQDATMPGQVLWNVDREAAAFVACALYNIYSANYGDRCSFH